MLIFYPFTAEWSQFQGQETEQDGANPEDVDTDEQNERQRFMPYMLKPPVVA